MLNVIDEFTHECLSIRVARRLKATDVIDVLSDLFILRGVSWPALTSRRSNTLKCSTTRTDSSGHAQTVALKALCRSASTAHIAPARAGIGRR
jgi:hypothetical protein